MDFRIVERVFSEDETMPTIMVANIYGVPDVHSNLDKRSSPFLSVKSKAWIRRHCHPHFDFHQQCLLAQ